MNSQKYFAAHKHFTLDGNLLFYVGLIRNCRYVNFFQLFSLPTTLL